eukprot:GHVQ01026735.1.p1 GENE.GHVQ01026735.1~~GHVQ01026735.1.p1  ORF type:complete len:460 (-),score=66.94 GHVQ01026735.1:62-1441(-)
MSRTMWNNKSPLLYSSLLLANFIFVLFASFLLLLLSSSSSSCYAAHAEVYSAVIEEVTEGIGLSPTAARGAYEGGEVVMSSTAVMGQQHKSVKERRRAVHTDVSDLTASSSSSTLSFTHPSRRMMITSDDQNVGFLFNFMRISKSLCTMQRIAPIFFLVVAVPTRERRLKICVYVMATILMTLSRYKNAPPPPPSVAVKDSVMSRYPWCVFIDLIATFTAFMSVEYIIRMISKTPEPLSEIHRGISVPGVKMQFMHLGRADLTRTDDVQLHLKFHRDIKDSPEMREEVRGICREAVVPIVATPRRRSVDGVGQVEKPKTASAPSRSWGWHIDTAILDNWIRHAVVYVAPFKKGVTKEEADNMNDAHGRVMGPLDVLEISELLDVDYSELIELKRYLKEVGVLGDGVSESKEHTAKDSAHSPKYPPKRFQYWKKHRIRNQKRKTIFSHNLGRGSEHGSGE